MFSSRVPAHLETNSLARAIERARVAGRSLIDLTVTNPTRTGISYPSQFFDALAKPEVATYSPEAFGLKAARQAVSRDYARRGLAVPWERIVLTASTSEAYSLLFKLLCAPSGDSVLVPVPSYPLFDHLTSLDGVRALSYPLEYAAIWSVDFSALDAACELHARAVLAVSPNNPTGSVLTKVELSALEERCADRAAALILDEVFADYPLDPAREAITNQGFSPSLAALTFRLGGLSKSAALPQVKLGWIAVDGPDDLVTPALERLELICDTYLSVSIPVQVAADDFIAGGAAARCLVLERIRHNHAQLRELVKSYPAIELLHADAGWSAVLRVPSRSTEEELALQLVEQDAVVVHPGFFFDFPDEAFLVVSLLPRPDDFREGVHRVLERADA
jgi:alanine-synthesizing transaminase